NGVWTYDAGQTLEDASGNWFWSNGVSLKNGSTFKHPNNTNFVSGSTIFYANGATFKNGSGNLFYPGNQTMRDASQNFFYQSGAQLKSGSTVYYANGSVMVDAAGNVFNDSGTPSFKPFTRSQLVGNNEYFTSADNLGSNTIVGVENDVSGSF